jgi:ubiquinone/menaquinone biosynthesis C-methylase UbiE
MRSIRDDNPFEYNRYGFAWEQVSPEDSVLDYGCHDGKTLQKLRRKDETIRRVGADLSADAIEKGRKLYPSLELCAIRKGEALPFPENHFDVVLLMDVIEHIFDQKGVLDELFRVLAPGGRIVVTVPGKHFFSWLDLGNYKFYFPRLHRRAVIFRHDREYYEYRYGEKNPFGLFGDVEKEKGIHEHFSRKSLSRLLDGSHFDAVKWDGAGWSQRVWSVLSLPLPAMLKGPFQAIMRLDMKLFNRANMFCVAEKRTHSK